MKESYSRRTEALSYRSDHSVSLCANVLLRTFLQHQQQQQQVEQREDFRPRSQSSSSMFHFRLHSVMLDVSARTVDNVEDVRLFFITSEQDALFTQL